MQIEQNEIFKAYDMVQVWFIMSKFDAKGFKAQQYLLCSETLSKSLLFTFEVKKFLPTYMPLNK